MMCLFYLSTHVKGRKSIFLLNFIKDINQDILYENEFKDFLLLSCASDLFVYFIDELPDCTLKKLYFF